MSCNVVNSQTQVQSRLPSLPQTLPQTQADWNAVLATLNQWGSILQQASHAPNVIPSQFQTFTSAAATAVLAALTASSVTPSIDSGTTYYGAATLKVVPSAGGTLAFSGYPISIAPASRWFASFQIYAPSGCTGSLTVKTSAGNSVTETFTVTAAAAWQQVWGLVDLRQYPDTQATWQLTFTSTSTVWFDGLQMNAVGSPIGVLPKFAGTQMVTGALAYQSNLDGVPDGSAFVRLLASNASGNVAYNFKGIWNSATAYVIADEVVYGPTYWLAIAPSTNSAPPSANWQAVGTYGAFQGAWSSVTAYPAGAEVTYTGNFWICVTANTNSAPTTSNVNWQIAGPTSLDAIADGTTYSRTLAAWVAAGVPYNYQGVWSSATAYVKGAEVSSGGNYWLAIAASTNQAPPNGTYWQLLGPTSLDNVSDGSTYSKTLAAYVAFGVPYNFQGAYSNTTAYAKGAEVSSGGNYYLCISSTTGNAPPNATYWQLLGPVSLDDLADGSTYARALASYLSNGRPWSNKGAYAGGTTYHQGDEVSYTGNYYLYINAASTAGNAPTNTTYWQLIGPTSLDDLADGATYARILANYIAVGRPWSYQGAYAGGTTYHQGDEVSSGGNYYLYTNATASAGNAPPNATYWQILGPVTLDNVADGSTYSRVLSAWVASGVPYNYQGAWSSATAYAKGAEVSSGGNYWLAIVASTNQAPPNATYWQLLGPTSLDNVADGTTYARALAAYMVSGRPWNYQGAYSGGTTYHQGDEVTSGGNYYLYINATASAGNAPPNSTYWVLLGPATLDNLPDGTTYQRVQRYQFGNNTATAAWMHLGTLILNGGSSATFRWHSGQGYNAGSNQQGIAEVLIRAGNNTSAPNISGISVIQHGAAPPLPVGPWAAVQLVATGNSTSATNISWEVFLYCANYTQGPVEVILNAAGGDSFTFVGTASNPGAPTNAYVNVSAQAYFDTTQGSGLDGLRDGATYMRFLASFLDATRRVKAENGAISPLGSIPPGAATVTFSYTSTATSVTISWTSGTIYRSDGTTTSVTAGNQTITGLSASTTYYVPIYYDETGEAIAFAAVSGGVGSPAIAYTTQSAVAAGTMILNAHATIGWYTVVTPASGSGGGGGPPSCCLNGEQPIELAYGPVIPARDLEAGYSLKCPEGPVRITKIRIDPWQEWFWVTFNTGTALFVAGDHRFIDPSGEEIHAHELKLQQILQSQDGYVYVTKLEFLKCSGEKVSIEVEEPHTYYVQGILSHNKFMCP